jgi:opacity protein-like surface antigen
MIYKDSSYRAVVSGVQPRLDSLEIYQKTRTETITKTVIKTQKTRWGVGVQAGMGWTGQKFQPYVGIGVQYNILTF